MARSRSRNRRPAVPAHEATNAAASGARTCRQTDRGPTRRQDAATIMTRLPRREARRDTLGLDLRRHRHPGHRQLLVGARRGDRRRMGRSGCHERRGQRPRRVLIPRGSNDRRGGRGGRHSAAPRRRLFSDRDSGRPEAAGRTRRTCEPPASGREDAPTSAAAARATTATRRWRRARRARSWSLSHRAFVCASSRGQADLGFPPCRSPRRRGRQDARDDGQNR
jgi:hypothetical protein